MNFCSSSFLDLALFLSLGVFNRTTERGGLIGLRSFELLSCDALGLLDWCCHLCDLSVSEKKKVHIDH